MHRLHVLIAVLVSVIALRGFQVLQLYGIVPIEKTGRLPFAQCSGRQLAPPYLGHLNTGAAEDNTMRSLQAWLRNSGAAIQNVQIGSFDGLRGLQAVTDISRQDVILAIPTRLCISIGTFTAAISAARQPLLTKLLSLKDGDMYLEVLALYHEALLHTHHLRQHIVDNAGRTHNANNSSQSSDGDEAAAAATAAAIGNPEVISSGVQPAIDFGQYVNSLPHTISLPLFLEDISSSSSSSSKPISMKSNSTDDLCQQLLRHLPHLQRLTSQRITGLKEAWSLVKPLLKALSKPAAKTLDRLHPCEQFQGFLWAYGMAKTRVVTLEVAAVPGVMGQVLSELGVDEIGVMVPLLDMANHAPGQQVNARVVGDGTAFRLAATQDIKAGEQITISYNPTDDERPICSWRWLLEYAFIPGSSSSSNNAPAESFLPAASQAPTRQCYAFNLTAEVVAKAYLQQRPQQGSSSESAVCRNKPDVLQQKQWQQIQQALDLAGLQALELDFWVELDGVGALPEGLLDWMGQIIAVSLSTQPSQLKTQRNQDSSSGIDQTQQQASVGAICHRSCAANAGGRSAGVLEVLQEDDAGRDVEEDKVPLQPVILQCIAKCVLRHIIEGQQQGLQETITYVQQQRQPAQGHPAGDAADVQDTEQGAVSGAVGGDCRLQGVEESGGKAASSDLQQAAAQSVEPGSCSAGLYNAASGRSGPAADAAVGICDLNALLTVAVDGRAALQTTLQGLAQPLLVDLRDSQ